jgi:hypothetical protein
MSKAARELRAALERFLLGEQAAHLARARDASEDWEPASREAGRWLLSSAGRDALAEALERDELEALEREVVETQLHALPYELERLRAERRLRAGLARLASAIGAPLSLSEGWARIGMTENARDRAAAVRELELALEPIALSHSEALLRAESLLHVEIQPKGAPELTPISSRLIVSAFDPQVLSPPKRDLPDAPWLEVAAAFLRATEAAADDAVGFLLRRLHGSGPRPLHTLVHAVRAPHLDSEVARRSRSLRVSAWLRALGFEPELHRMRAEVDRSAIGPCSAVLLVDAPRDVRVVTSLHESGAVSDLFAADGVARGLAHALCHPALPTLVRIAGGPSTAGAFGLLGMLAWADREQLVRVQGLTDLQAERVSRLLSTYALLEARALVSLALLPAFELSAARGRLEAQAEALSSALRVEVPPFVAGVLANDRVGARGRALERLAGLAAAHGLRERFDADWYRNPRSADVLRAAAARGVALRPEAFALELGAALSVAGARASELVA